MKNPDAPEYRIAGIFNASERLRRFAATSCRLPVLVRTTPNYEPEAIPYTLPVAFDWGSPQIAVAIPFLPLMRVRSRAAAPGPKCSVKLTPTMDGQYKFVIKNAGGANTVTFNVKVAK